MFSTTAKWIVTALAAPLAACAFITVNVYFPEKEVKKAFKTLDETYLKEGAPPEPTLTPPDNPPLDSTN